MSRIISAFEQFFDDSGDPLVNGFLQFYESGTNNTDKNTYADINELIPNANPVPLDGAGRCPNVFGSGTYNVISFTSAMVQIQQFDPVNLEATEGAFVTWNSQTIYGEGDIVTGSDGNYYRSIVAGNQNQEPSISPGQWEEIILLGEWNSVVTYDLYDVVLLDGVFYTSKTASNTGNNPTTSPTNWGSGVSSVQDFGESLVSLIHPDTSKGTQDLQKQNVFPVSYNPQWGGMGYGGLPDGTLGEVATGYIIHNSFMNIGSGSTNDEKVAQGFKVSKSQTLSYVWIKMSKEGNPTDNTTLEIWDDSTGPNAVITNGVATSISSKLISDNADGEWVKFEFATPPSLSSNTLYFITVGRSGAFSTSNRARWLSDTVTASYPHGTLWELDASWTENTGERFAFIVDAATTILSTGLAGFDGALHCYEGAPLDQSGAFYYSNEDLNHKRGMIHLAGTGFTKDKTIYDSGLGTDNNRIVIRCNVTTGFAQVDLYENDETKLTVTGTTDISTGNRIVSVGYRSEGDGADFLKLYVDGASEGTELTSQTITLDPQFVSQGHTTIGGGFPLAPTWTDNEDMSVLPSASGWTWTGTATEANAMAVDGGILYQNGAGYASTDTGYYDKTTTLNNATGWTVEAKLKVSASNNAPTVPSLVIDIFDGSYRHQIKLFEYFMQYDDGTIDHSIQVDLTKLTTIKVVCKGLDVYIYANNKLIFDGTGIAANVNATNTIRFGDGSTAAGENSTAEWSYFKYYEGAHLPQYTSGQLSEIANWNDDKSALLSTIYNSGTIQSVKTLAGMNENYVKAKKQVISVKGITLSPTTTSSSFVPLAELSVFVFGGLISANVDASLYNSNTSSRSLLDVSINGYMNTSEGQEATSASANYRVAMSQQREEVVSEGMHFVAAVFAASANTTGNINRKRTLTVESE